VSSELRCCRTPNDAQRPLFFDQIVESARFNFGLRLNSALCRFYWTVCLRAAVIQGYYSTIYTRILDSLPWPANFTGEQDELLKEKYNQLGKLCVVARNNPINWLLSAVEGSDSISLGSKRFGVEFNGWQDVTAPDELTLDGNTVRGGLLTVIDCRDAAIGELLYTVLTAMDSEVTITSDMLQKFKIPKNLEEVMTEYRTRRTAFQEVEGDFHTLLSDLDEAVFKAFAVDSSDQVHIESRLAQFPSNRLKPATPGKWQNPGPSRHTWWIGSSERNPGGRLLSRTPGSGRWPGVEK
jgi:hypothetical protein